MELPNELVLNISELLDVFSLAYLRQTCKLYDRILKEIAEKRNPDLGKVQIKLHEDHTITVNISLVPKRINIKYGLEELEQNSNGIIQCFEGYYLFINDVEWCKYIPHFIQDPKWNSKNVYSNRWIDNEKYHNPRKAFIQHSRSSKMQDCAVFVTEDYKIIPMIIRDNNYYQFIFNEETYKQYETFLYKGSNVVQAGQSYWCKVSYLKD